MKGNKIMWFEQYVNANILSKETTTYVQNTHSSKHYLNIQITMLIKYDTKGH